MTTSYPVQACAPSAMQMPLDPQPLPMAPRSVEQVSPHAMGAVLDALGQAERRRPVAVVPLQPAACRPDAVAMLVLGVGAQPDGLAQQLFCRLHRLTPVESQVLAALAALADGLNSVQIAQQSGVAISTVRTQLGTIRTKSDAASLRQLMQQVACLPPLMGAALTRPG